VRSIVFARDDVMPRLTAIASAIVFGAILCAGAAGANDAMNPTAPTRMMPPDEKARLDACRQKAAQQNIKMDERARFIMDCMKDMAK
jgi:hypothetical protein